jgi:pyruvate formate lyase activating enzyme
MIMPPIKGLQKTSLIDYPDRICSVIFLPGCDFRCPYCQNPDLINNPEKLPTLDESEFLEFLKNRKGLIDGVCITGGEPTIHKDLPELVKKIKETGLLVKLDTNGSNPDMLEHLLNSKLLDYIAMDIKAPLNKYEKVVRVKVSIDKIKESIEMIRNSGVEYEFRSTVLPELHTKDDIVEIARMIRGARKYYLQQFRPLITLDPAFKKCSSFTKKELQKIAKECSKFVPTEVRV